MSKKGSIYCFRANYEQSKPYQLPEWLCLESNWQGYRVYTRPWIADVARVLGLLWCEDTPEAWIAYLEDLGFKGVEQVCCEDFWEDKLYS